MQLNLARNVLKHDIMQHLPVSAVAMAAYTTIELVNMILTMLR